MRVVGKPEVIQLYERSPVLRLARPALQRLLPPAPPSVYRRYRAATERRMRGLAHSADPGVAACIVSEPLFEILGDLPE